MQGEELAKVRETSLALLRSLLGPGEMIPKKMFSIGYNFPRANP
jgi:hypothetical protein